MTMTHVSERPSVVVQHVTSGDVEHHIKKLHTTRNRRSMKPTLGLTREFINDVNPAQRRSSAAVRFRSNDEHDNVDMVEPIAEDAANRKIFDDVAVCTNELAGLSVYGFKTPKRAKQMAKYASKSVKKNMEKKTTNETKEVVKDIKNAAVDNDPSTPSKNLRSAKRFSIQAVTVPLNESDESDSTDSDHGEKYEENVMRSAKKSTVSKRCDGKTSAIKSLELPSETELYFDAHKGRTKQSATTSDRTLANLGGLNMSLEKMQHILGKYKNTCPVTKAQEKLVLNHKQQFRKWMFHICCGYNILLFGLGSKRKLIHEFCDSMLSNQTKVVINGYFPNLTMKSILTAISEEVLGKTATFGNTQLSQVDSICSHFSDHDQGTESSHLFLIIHNIDGMMLRSNKAQTILSQLASCSRIHLIASVDHINASLIWNQAKLCKYKWAWFDATTYEHYMDETSYEHSLLQLTSGAGIGGSLALTGLLHVARSLTPNARGIFKILAEYQIEESKANPNNYIGLPFSDLYQQCRERFLVNSELTLRTQLTEFVDHKLVLIKKGGDGAEYLSIPLDASTLQEYLDQALA